MKIVRGLAGFATDFANADVACSQKALMDMQETRRLLRDNDIYVDAARIAQDVYDPGMVCLSGGWTRSYEFADLMEHSVSKEKDGLVSHLYSRIKRGRKEYIYAIAGTDPRCRHDWENILLQLYTSAPQFQSSLQIAKALKERIGDNGTLMFAGHSLGGGIATNNALHTGLRAIVFNPCGLSDATLRAVHGTRRPDIDCLIASNDILNVFQDTCQSFGQILGMIPSCFGRRIYLRGSGNLVEGHRISTMVRIIEEYRKTERMLSQSYI